MTARLSKRLIPLLNRVLVKKDDPATKSKGGVVLPENKRAHVSRGIVLAVGPGIVDKTGTLIPVQLSVGDAVLLPDYGGTRITEDGQEYFIYRDVDILVKISREGRKE